MLTKNELQHAADSFTMASAFNYVDKGEAISKEYIGVKLYDEPLIGYGRADDPLFEYMKNEDAVGSHFILPQEWLPGAKTVISFFIPLTEEIKKSNYMDDDVTSDLWLHGRIEGHRFLEKLAEHLKKELESRGFKAMIPAQDERFKAVEGPSANAGNVLGGKLFNSNWSERHVAYICGLGTFGLSKGLITEKGMAGRFGSLITDASFEATERAYSGIYDYCIECGACVRRCPVNAISLEDGKDHYGCGEVIAESRIKYSPRYGCGKCQTKVPCESRIPKK